jgi:hypothetical protein
MDAHHHVHSFEAAVADHRLRASLALLGGLEEDAHRSGQAAPDERLRRRHRHRHVPVVPTGMHPSGREGGVGSLAVLLDGEGVHVRAEEHGRAAAAAEARDHPGASHTRAHLEARGLEEGRHPGRRARFRVGQLGMLVQLAAQRGHLGLQGADVVGESSHVGIVANAD